ncbi:adaptor protein MecA, partial [Jeotgalibaca porci]
MEMENINENTIRVVIESSDLEERGITFLDLLGNQKQIESFFYSILEEVDVENQFLETDAITFQVLPKGSGLE